MTEVNYNSIIFLIFSGPAIVTKDDIIDPHNLNLKCHVNNAVKQDSNTNQMIFKIWDIISWLTSFFTLNPGDIILTGSPPGSGKYQKPTPQFLKVLLHSNNHCRMLKSVFHFKVIIFL